MVNNSIASSDADHQQSITAARGVIERTIPQYADCIKLEVIPDANGSDVFEITSRDGVPVIRGSNAISICAGFNWYLKYACNAHVSACGDQKVVPVKPPIIKSSICKISSCKYRYFLNYCSYGYVMPFWDWPLWQHELDWMALNGINMPLAIVGNEAVWQRTMQRLGSTPQEIQQFLPGPAFMPWWLMGNLEGWGGPVPQQSIDRQVALQQKILARMRELGMKPILQGFYGVMPTSFIRRFPDAKITPGLDWCGFKRPAFLMPTDPLFAKIANVFYEEQTKLYGEAPFYCGDPFHEGGLVADVNLTDAGHAIQSAMLKVNPQAGWVLMAWQDNPRDALLEGMSKDHILVLDLAC